MTIHKNAESIYMDEKIQECLSESDFDFYLTGSQSYEVRTNRDSDFYVSGAHLEKVQEFLTSCGFRKVYMKDYLEDTTIHSVWRVISESDWKKMATDVQIILPQFMSRKHQVNALMIATKGMGQENYDKLSRNKAWFALMNMPLDILAHPSADREQESNDHVFPSNSSCQLEPLQRLQITRSMEVYHNGCDEVFIAFVADDNQKVSKRFKVENGALVVSGSKMECVQYGGSLGIALK